MENVELLQEGYRAVCAICGTSVDPNTYADGERPFKTFSFGDAPDTNFAAGVVTFCREHIEQGNALAVMTAFVTGRMTQITAALAQWELPDGTHCPVFCYGTVVYDDGRTEARIVPIESAEPLCVPLEQVALYRPPPKEHP